MEKNTELKKVHEEIFINYKEKNYLAEVSNQGKQDTKEILLHFPIVKQDKETTKVRIVLNAAVKQNGITLNDTIFTGPTLQQESSEILMNVKEVLDKTILDQIDRKSVV